METLNAKTQLLQEIEAIKDFNLIDKIAAFVKKEKEYDFADDLPKHVLEGIQRGKQESANGEGASAEKFLIGLRNRLCER